MNELRRITPAEIDVDDIGHNLSDNPSFQSLIEARVSRRQTLLGGLGAATTAIFASTGLAGCSDDDDAPAEEPEEPPPTPLALGFTAVAKSLEDEVIVPDGYTASVLYRLGDPIATGVADWANDGTDGDMDKRAGDHHDGMYYFGLGADGKFSATASDSGLLVMNHENITESYLHPAGPTTPRPEAEVRKEIACHGVSVIEVARSAGQVTYKRDSAFNRRITASTEMELSGPVRGSRFAVTKFSTNATRTRGTINNCANGYTPWGTYLTCEENWAGYFARAADDNAKRASWDVAQLNRVGISQGNGGSYAWSTVVPADAADTSFARWNASVLGISANGSDDFRNAPNTYGYIVEIDPFNAASTPKKRTALGRFGHEGCWPAKAVAGEPVVFYMGDDSRGEYVYKFVSDAAWDPADATAGLTAGDKYLDFGTLYVARFSADGSGQWIALQHGANGLTEDNALFPFTSQAAVIVATRLAADSVGATKMDRPEWTAVNPENGEVYLTLTNNNSSRGTSVPLDAANPRRYTDEKFDEEGEVASTSTGNPNGHIIRWREDGDSAAATTFQWDVYLFAAEADAGAAVNLSGLDDTNDLSSPDGLWFSSTGLLWIQTDDGAYTDETNCMMLAAVPGSVGDGAAVDVVSGDVTVKSYVGAAPGADLRRFLVGPTGCEITGIAETPDGKTLFVNIQHPGEGGDTSDITSNWPDGGSARPRSATIVITRNDGGMIGVG